MQIIFLEKEILVKIQRSIPSFIQTKSSSSMIEPSKRGSDLDDDGSIFHDIKVSDQSVFKIGSKILLVSEDFFDLTKRAFSKFNFIFDATIISKQYLEGGSIPQSGMPIQRVDDASTITVMLNKDLRLLPIYAIPNIVNKLWNLFRNSENAAAMGGDLKPLSYYDKMVRYATENKNDLYYAIVQGYDMNFLGVLFFNILVPSPLKTSSSPRNKFKTHAHFFKSTPLWYQGLDHATRPKIRSGEKDMSIGIYLMPQSRRKGIGSKIIPMGLCHVRKIFPQVSRIYASIYSDNVASTSFFRKEGFGFVGISNVPNMSWKKQQKEKEDKAVPIQELSFRQTVVMSKTYL